MKETAPDTNSPEIDYEEILANDGMPPELPLEYQRAAEAGIELVSLGAESPEGEALARRLEEEDPNNKFKGFPTSLDMLISFVENLRDKWLAKGIASEDIRVAFHTSCINGHECVVLYNTKGGKKYHYNTKRIPGYSRKEMVARFGFNNITCTEK